MQRLLQQDQPLVCRPHRVSVRQHGGGGRGVEGGWKGGGRGVEGDGRGIMERAFIKSADAHRTFVYFTRT